MGGGKPPPTTPMLIQTNSGIADVPEALALWMIERGEATPVKRTAKRRVLQPKETARLRHQED